MSAVPQMAAAEGTAMPLPAKCCDVEKMHNNTLVGTLHRTDIHALASPQRRSLRRPAADLAFGELSSEIISRDGPADSEVVALCSPERLEEMKPIAQDGLEAEQTTSQQLRTHNKELLVALGSEVSDVEAATSSLADGENDAGVDLSERLPWEIACTLDTLVQSVKEPPPVANSDGRSVESLSAQVEKFGKMQMQGAEMVRQLGLLMSLEMERRREEEKEDEEKDARDTRMPPIPSHPRPCQPHPSSVICPYRIDHEDDEKDGQDIRMPPIPSHPRPCQPPSSSMMCPWRQNMAQLRIDIADSNFENAAKEATGPRRRFLGLKADDDDDKAKRMDEYNAVEKIVGSTFGACFSGIGKALSALYGEGGLVAHFYEDRAEDGQLVVTPLATSVLH
jgi:hypothetical protein